MEALIIAAGQGSRLRKRFSPKPLLKIFGLRFLEIVILSVKYSGIYYFKILQCYKAASMKKELAMGKNMTFI